jgi:hypothetical protein
MVGASCSGGTQSQRVGRSGRRTSQEGAACVSEDGEVRAAHQLAGGRVRLRWPMQGPHRIDVSREWPADRAGTAPPSTTRRPQKISKKKRK